MNYLSYDIYEEIYVGINERYAAIDHSPYDVFQVTNNTMSADPITIGVPSWYELQGDVETLGRGFIDNATLPLDGLTNTAFVLYTSETLRTAAGVSSNGFRRATNYDPQVDDWTVVEGGMWTNTGNGYGQIQEFDVFGPWIPDDIQRMLGVMDVVELTSADFVSISTNHNIASGTGGTSNTWAAAQASLSAVYPTSLNFYKPALPRKFYSGSQNSGGNYTASAIAQENEIRIILGSNQTNLTGTVDYYAFSEKISLPGNVAYDANGEDLIEDAWSLFDTFAYTAGGGVTNLSATMGSLSLGNPPTAPIYPTQAHNGFDVTDEAATFAPTFSHDR